MNIFDRLKKVMPDHVKPIASNPMDHLAAMEKISQDRIKRDDDQNRQDRIKYIMGCSGVSPLHHDCSFENYLVSNQDQQAALNQAKEFANTFGIGFGGFIFSGSCGTGKNHLAAAICNSLISKGKTVLCITIPDLMMKFRTTYGKNSEISEEGLLNELANVDLLILDEVGIQHRNSENTPILINQIVDRRTSHKKPIGMLTNLSYDELKDSKILGLRVIDRMMMDSGLWVNFNWESYRSRVSSHEKASSN